MAYPQEFSEELLWMFWYLLNHYHILIEFKSDKFRKFHQLKPWVQNFLLWFNNYNYWISLFKSILGLNKYVTIWFHKPVHIHQWKSFPLPLLSILKWNRVSVLDDDEEYSELQRSIFQENKCIPKEIWPGLFASWNYSNTCMDRPYYQWVKDAMKDYHENDVIWNQDAQDPYSAYLEIELS